MSRREGRKRNKIRQEISTKKGDDTMSAVAQNYVYTVNGRKDPSKAEPTISKEKLENLKNMFDKYLTKDK